MKDYRYPLYDVKEITDLKDLLEKTVEEFKERTAFWVRPAKGQKYEPVTFSQFHRDIRELCSALVKLGLQDKKVAIISENRYEWAISYFAAAICAGFVVPIDRELPDEDLHTILNAAEAGCVIYSEKLSDCVIAWAANREKQVVAAQTGTDRGQTGANKAHAAGAQTNADRGQAILLNMDIAEDNEAELSFRLARERGRAAIAAGDSSYDDAVIDPMVAKILLFTSGTTATPKGVLLTHGNIATNLMAMCQMIFVGIDDIFLSVLPLHHTYECTCGFLCPFYRGASVAYSDGLKYILSNIKEVGATMMLGVPALFEAMYRRIWAMARKNGIEGKLKTGLRISGAARRFGVDLRRKLFAQIHDTFGGRLRLFIAGAAAIDPSVAKGFRDLGISFLQGYGITECSPIVALNRDKRYRDNAAGLALPGMEIKLINQDENGIGEIVCRGGNVTLGYYKNPEADAEAFVDGWFRTGDLAMIDKDGFFIITGRKKNVIVTKNGKNIYPEELEYLVNKYQEVKDCMVIGEFSEKDQDTLLGIQVLPDLDYIKETYGEKSPEEVEKIINDVVLKVNKRNVIYKYIRNVYLRDDEFVKTTTKKIKRHAQAPLQPK